MSRKKKLSKVEQAQVEKNGLELAFKALANDQTFQGLDEERQHQLVREVSGIGVEAAQWVRSEFGENDPRKIASLLGVKVLGEEKNRRQRGTLYSRERKEIVVFRQYHDKLVQEIHSPELAGKLLKFLVAYQLFYHLEADRFGEVHKRYKFPVWSMGPYVREKQVPSLSKVAAQAFTIALLELELTPQVYEPLAMILQSCS